MMKRIYICLLMLMVLSTATFAQKKGSPEYNAQLRATIIAMDSVLKYSRVVPDILMRFADEQCAKFKNDPAVMDSIAEAFYRFYNNEIYGERRYAELKRLHPEYSEVYLNEARMFHSIAYKRDEHGVMKRDSANLTKARVLKDSAKIKMPNSPEPYLLWMRLQAKFDEKDADDEIEALKRNFPNYPADLEAARYYDFIAKGDYNYLLVNALNHYEKVDLNTMKNSDLAAFSLLCTRANSADIWEKGLSVAEFGINKFPDYPSLYRFALWNAGKIKKWDDAERYGEMFLQLSDTIQKLSNDYKYLAMAKQEKKSYTDAIDFYRLQMSVPGISDDDCAHALGDIIDCYRGLGNLENAKQAFVQYEKLRLSNGMSMEAAHYQKIFNIYSDVMNDTSNSVDIRKDAYINYDSIVRIAIKASPNYTGRLSQLDIQHVRVFSQFDPSWTEDPRAHPKWGEVSLYMVEANRNYIASITESEKTVNDSYFLMFAYRHLLDYYVYSDRKEDAYGLSEIMVEMPLAFELQGLSKTRMEDYIKNYSRAEEVHKAYAIYGRKKRR